MHNHQVLIFTAPRIFVFGLFSRVSERWAITGPMVFMVVGTAVSPLGVGLFSVHPTGDLVKLVAATDHCPAVRKIRSSSS